MSASDVINLFLAESNALSDKSDSRSKAFIAIAITLGLLGIFLLLAVAQIRRDSSVTRERRVGNSSTIQVKAGGNLQAAIDEANYGDVIVLEAGATYKGPITLPSKKGASDQYITITTSNLSGIAKENERINPQLHAKAMPKIVGPDSSAAIATAEQAHHYKFIGIEFAPAPDSKYLYNLIDLGKSDYKSLTQFPHDLVFDRCYIHSTGLNKARRGFGLNSGDTTISNSYISEIHMVGIEAPSREKPQSRWGDEGWATRSPSDPWMRW